MKNKTAEELQKLSIMTVITGSTMYGLDIETSDEDLKSVVKVPQNELLTLEKEWETSVFHDPDTEYHLLKKMIKLLNSQNPTVLEMLYAEPQFYKKLTDEGRELIENRHLFLSQNCYNSFNGYAQDQLMRIKNGLNKATLEDNQKHLEFHMKSLIDLMPEKYESVDQDTIWLDSSSVDHMGKASVFVGLKENVIPLSELGGMVSEMNASLRQYNKINNRNRKPEKKLYKHAMHLVRLVKSGIYVQQYGELKTSMKDEREQLIAIRNGEMGWDEFFLYVDSLFDEMKNAREKTVLPARTDSLKIEKLYKKLQN